MLILLILSFFTIIQCQELSQLIKNQYVYVPREDLLLFQQVDNDDTKPPVEMTTAGEREESQSETSGLNDDADNTDKNDDAVQSLNRVKAQEFIDSNNGTNWVSIRYRPTQAMTAISTTSTRALPKLKTRYSQLLQTSVLSYSEEPWPTLTVSTFAVILPVMPTRPPKTAPPTWRSHFPPVRTSPRHDDEKTSKVTNDVQNFTTEGPIKYDIGILDRYIYPDDSIFTTVTSEEFTDYNRGSGIMLFPSQPTVTSTTNMTPTRFTPRKKSNARVVKLLKATRSRRPVMREGSHINEYRAAKAVKWICYTCGLNETELGSPKCDRVFESGDQRYRGMRMYFQTKCDGISYYTGGCFMRSLDVGGVYSERGCRAWPPLKGKSYASKRFMKLESLLKYRQEGCVTSPHSTLTPFSRSVYLYARFHVCVCKGKLCNTTAATTPEWPLGGLVSLFWLMSIMKQR